MHDFWIAAQNTAAWLVVVLAAAGAVGGVWVFVDTVITGGGKLVRRLRPPAISGQTVPCLWCAEPLTFTAGYGWHHAEGGLYAMRCDCCGWSGAPRVSPRHCPRCDSEKVRDSHCGTPNFAASSEREAEFV